MEHNHNGSNGNVPTEQTIRFELTIPLTYNPPAPGVPRTPIPERDILEVQRLLCERFGGCKSWEGVGISSHPDCAGPYDTEPELYFRVNVPQAETMAAWDWFGLYCPQWARLFQQHALYLELPEQGRVYYFRPDQDGGNEAH